jgi:hypothetical protein
MSRQALDSNLRLLHDTDRLRCQLRPPIEHETNDNGLANRTVVCRSVCIGGSIVIERCGSITRYIVSTALEETVATAITQAIELAHPLHFTAMNPTPFLALLQAFLNA